MSLKLLIIEPYYGGSHKTQVDGLAKQLPFETNLWTAKPRKWKWRMRSSGLHFSDKFKSESLNPDVIFASSFLNVPEFVGLLPQLERKIPTVIYFHENQLTYPVRHEDERDLQFGWTHITNALAADSVVWNTEYNRDSFLNAIPKFIKRMPDDRPGDIVNRIKEKSIIIPVPINTSPFTNKKDRTGKIPRIIWNHRWEHDKAPEIFFEALQRVLDNGVEFEVSVVGEQFKDVPECFEQAKQILGDRITQFGYCKTRVDYIDELLNSDIAVSTAIHEFQGLSMLESAAAGCRPIVPNNLSYPEIWPEHLRYKPGSDGLTAILLDSLTRIDEIRNEDFCEIAKSFDWSALLPKYEEIIRKTAEVSELVEKY